LNEDSSHKIEIISSKYEIILKHIVVFSGGTWWHSWLRHCTTSRKVMGSIPDSVIGIFH